MDLSHAVPASALAKLPPTAQQFRSLRSQIVRTSPAVASAKQQSDTLEAQARALKEKLVATAARIESLEAEKISLGAQIATLQAQDAALSVGFASDRIAVTRLLAILERLQHDMPPAMAVHPDDALGAARSAMLVGASLPPVYARAAALARRIEALKATRKALIARRAEAFSTATALDRARIDLAALLAEKQRQADAAGDKYAGLRAILDRVATQAANLQILLAKVSRLRGEADEKTLVTVTAENKADRQGLARGSLLVPVVGRRLPPSPDDGSRNPGLTFATAPDAQVIAPSDGKVLFAGPYHKSGHVLILEITTGYDLVLAGLGRVTVRPGDELLAGEPVGTMPDADAGQDTSDAMRLYFELRQNGHELNPAPWLTPQTAPKTAKAKKI
jgi:septal ring factor EnvC (AmiA/AmiB activator)